MPAFQAINLEPEENVDEQIDTTKELQVDEALKRFQTALKLHAQGARSREAAAAAYDELFESEIFKYREARTDYERSELQADGQVETEALESFLGELDIDAGGADGVAATLSLALYLGYKNYGDFFLDRLKDIKSQSPSWSEKACVSYRKDKGDVILDNWSKALDQDPSDPEFWRRVARFGAALNSGRLKRFCLEAAIELEDDPAAAEVEPPSIAEGLAGEQLREHLEVLGDQVALTHPILSPWREKDMPDLLKRHIDPISFLPDPTQTMTPPPSSPNGSPHLLQDVPMADLESKEAQEHGTIAVSSWTQLGAQLIQQLEDTKAALLICEDVLEEASSETSHISPAKDIVAQSKPDKTQTTSGMGKKEAAENAREPGSDVSGRKNVESGVPQDASQEKPTDGSQNGKSQSQSTTRKRTQSAAGLADAANEEVIPEKRSKRVRRRETMEASEASASGPTIGSQLQPYQEADSRLFELTTNILENLGVENKGTFDRLRELQELPTTEDRASALTPLASKDLRAAVTRFSEEAARILMNKEEKATLNLSSFLEHAKSGSSDQTSVVHFDEQKRLKRFVDEINRNPSAMCVGDVAFEWVRAMSSTYAEQKWSEETKTLVVQMLNKLHGSLHQRITEELEYARESPERLEDLRNIIPMIFELHVDIYERITNPSSVVDYATRVETKDRLSRWLNIASAYVQLVDRPQHDALNVRFIWAAVMTASHADDPVREHMLLMWTSLRDLLSDVDFEAIALPNNMVMPTVSAEAADREISKLTTMDFFLGLFQDEMEDPVHVIETLEPVLNPSSVHIIAQPKLEASENDNGEESRDEGNPISECAGQGLRDLWKFLSNSSTELRLFLWSQLGIAYDSIGYRTKTFSCHLRCVEMIIAELEGESYSKSPDDSRRLLLLRMLKSVDDHVIPALSMGLNEPDVFDIIDEDHIKSSTSALARLNCLLHVAALSEDEVRLGIRAMPSNKSIFQSFNNKLREMQVRAWTLQYTLFNAAAAAQQGTFISLDHERANYLSAIHQVLGLRKFCKASNKIFLNLMRRELLGMDIEKLENWEDYLEQVLWDLYGLKLGVSNWELQDHDCPHEALQKPKTLQLVERVTILANRMPIKELLKSELKTTIDHMQQTIGQLKSNAQMIHNLRNFTEYLKKPIHPLRLYRALLGKVDLDAVNVPPHSDALLAEHGWFFLLGMIALTKFKGVDLNRRQTPGATDDLRIGATFLRLQLQFTPDRWDAWFRLAECYDYELDEAVLWTADKINKDRGELIKFQRHAIHCYTLALSHSRNSNVESHDGDGDPLHDLYQRFGMRLYASSREPFAMEPFKHAEQERFFIEAMGTGTFKRIIHDEMSHYKVWKYAAVLFKRAIKRQPNNWKNAYMLAKCYWKMYTTKIEDLDSTDKDARISTHTVLNAIRKSVEIAYNARKSKRSEPILEPHYKIVSILHKMVKHGDLPAKEAAAILSEQPFGVPVNDDDHFASFVEPEDWEEYIISNLSKLRDKDKSNWQHRIIMRHAGIVFDEHSADEDLLSSAKAAFNILSDSMLTKTMVMNVWKCDAERPGRHHVYTEQYTRFVTKLLVIMSDRVNMEQLLKRIRKKGADFYHFSDLWHTCCMEFLKLLRRSYDIPDNVEEVFKSMSTEEFEMVSEKITEWAAAPGTDSTAFNCMKEAIELKKLNGGLTRSGPIDDLVNDCYSKIYVDIRGTLPGIDSTTTTTEKPKEEEKEDAGAIAGEDPIVDEQKAEEPDATEPKDDEVVGDEPMTDAPNPDASEGKHGGALQGLLHAPDNEDSRRTTPTPQDSERPEAGPRTKKTGIRRPDVVRKAEQAILRSLEPKAGTTKSRVGSVSSKRGSHTPAVHMSDDDDSEDGPDAQVRREAGEGMDLDSRDVEKERRRRRVDSDGESLHENDGDDESDLSDAPEASDEEMPPGLMFPNLRREDTNVESSGEEADSEDEGEEDGEAEEQAEEDHDVTEDIEGDETIEDDQADEEIEEEAGELEDEEGDAEMVDPEQEGALGERDDDDVEGEVEVDEGEEAEEEEVEDEGEGAEAEEEEGEEEEEEEEGEEEEAEEDEDGEEEAVEGDDEEHDEEGDQEMAEAEHPSSDAVFVEADEGKGA